MRVNTQIVIQNTNRVHVKVVEVIDIKNDVDPLSPLILQVLSDMPLIQPDVKVFSTFGLNVENINVENKQLINETDVGIVVVRNLLTRDEVIYFVSSKKERAVHYLISKIFKIEDFDNTSVY